MAGINNNPLNKAPAKIRIPAPGQCWTLNSMPAANNATPIKPEI